MPYRSAFASTRYLPRLWIDWFPFGWEQVLTGLVYLPPPFLISCVSALPLYTASVLFLDAAPAVPNVAIGGVITVVIAVVGWLLNRTITAFDNSVKETKDAVMLLSQVVTKIGNEQTASSKLQEYLEKRVATLEHKKEVLEKSFAEMDKLIAIKLNNK